MAHKEKYELVISNANLDGMRKSFNLTLRPWQTSVVNAFNQQDDCSVLWVFDFDGNSGKTTLSNFLMFKLNYQFLKPPETHVICSMIDSRAAGFAFDIPRSGVSKVNDLFSLVGDLREKFLMSTSIKELLNSYCQQNRDILQSSSKSSIAQNGSLELFSHPIRVIHFLINNTNHLFITLLL